MKYLLMAYLAATLFMVGVIWFMQVVQYTLFEKFAFYPEAHSRRSSSCSTALLEVPRHNTSGSGFGEGDYEGLVLSNRVRTAAPARGGLILSQAARTISSGGVWSSEVVHITHKAHRRFETRGRGGVLGNRRIALKPHAIKIRHWVDEGRGDDWIAQELNTTPSSVQSFRSRNSIYRRDPVRRGRLSEHPVVLDESDGRIVLMTDALNSEVFANEWRGYLRRDPQDLQIVITQDRIYLEKVH